MVVGIAHRHPMTTEEDFFLARRSGNILLISGSLLATILGSFGVLGISGLGYKMGLTGGWYLWSGVIGLFLLGGWGLNRLRIHRAFTLPELLGRIYGAPMRQASALLIVLAWFSIIAAQIIAAGKMIQFIGIQGGWWSSEAPVLGWIMLVATAVFTVYTCLGGQHSVLRTDLFQAVLILGGVSGIVIVALNHSPDAFSKITPSFFDFPTSEKLPPISLLTLILTFGVPFMVGPDIYSRLFSGKNRRTGQYSLLIAAGLLVPIVLIIVFGGMMGQVILGDSLKDADTVLLELAKVLDSPLLGGLLAAALLAAVMSSADTCLLTVSTLVCRDLIDSWFPERKDPTKVLWRSRWVIVITGLFSLVLALYLGSIVKALWVCYKVYSPAVLMPFIFMLLFPRRKLPTLYGVSALLMGGTLSLSGVYFDANWVQLLAFILPAIPLSIGHFVHRR